MSDPLLPTPPEPGDERVHDVDGGENVTVLRSFMVTAATLGTLDDSPAIPAVVFDLVLADLFDPNGPAVPLRMVVEHSDRSTRELLAGLQRSIDMLDNLARGGS